MAKSKATRGAGVRDRGRESRLLAGDLVVSEPVNQSAAGAALLGADRLTFDGYKLRWMGSSPDEYDAFSGQADESAKESVKDFGPTPQGLFAVDPVNIEDIDQTDKKAAADWGAQRVRIEPYATTVKRMTDCFKLVRTGMYVHGGTEKGTAGCIELNDAAQHASFFAKLKSYAKKIELEVRYVGAREKSYEESKCPY